jgi:hypothetical protein
MAESNCDQLTVDLRSGKKLYLLAQLHHVFVAKNVIFSAALRLVLCTLTPWISIIKCTSTR